MKHPALIGVFSALIVALLTAGPVSANSAPRPAAAQPPAIVIGFVGGFVSPENRVHSEVQFADQLRRIYPSGVNVEVFGDHRVNQAHQRVLALLAPGGHGALSNDEKQDARIVLYGHSWGGAAVVELARALQRDGVPVLLTIQIDAVPKNCDTISVIPSNVREAVNFYQPHGLLHGVRQIRAQDPSRTRIVGNFRFDYTHSNLRCPAYPWWDRYFMKAHTQIECDPAVWNKVESLITAVLPVPPPQNPAVVQHRLASSPKSSPRINRFAAAAR